jgi:broad specificity phosphatase PhoE
MKRLCTLCCFALAGIVVCLPFGLRGKPPCGPDTTLIVLRHADRPASGQDELTPQGVARARELVHVLRKARVTAIYRTETNRSRDTAAPLATVLGLTPEPYTDVPGLVSRIFARHRGKTVLVLAHSNTVPLLISRACGPTLPDVAENEYDNLFLVTVGDCPGGIATLVNLQYGAPSP